MKRLFLVAAFWAMATGAFAAVNWQQSYDAALQKARQEKKLVMVDVYTDWCGWCKKLDKDTYSHKNVEAKLAKDFVSLKINPEKSAQGAKLAKDFGTRGFPHIVFLDATGKKISEIGGYLPADKFLKQLEQVADKAKKQ
jgi:thiol:disulfide interchange protein